jgi:hypothetical protein
MTAEQTGKQTSIGTHKSLYPTEPGRRPRAVSLIDFIPTITFGYVKLFLIRAALGIAIELAGITVIVRIIYEEIKGFRYLQKVILFETSP